MSFLDEFQFPDELSISPQLLISKALFIDLANQITWLFYIYIDLKIKACQLNAITCQWKWWRCIFRPSNYENSPGEQSLRTPEFSPPPVGDLIAHVSRNSCNLPAAQSQLLNGYTIPWPIKQLHTGQNFYYRMSTYWCNQAVFVKYFLKYCTQ